MGVILAAVSSRFRDNAGAIWVATYSPAPNATGTGTDGSHYVRAVLLATNTFGPWCGRVRARAAHRFRGSVCGI